MLCFLFTSVLRFALLPLSKLQQYQEIVKRKPCMDAFEILENLFECKTGTIKSILINIIIRIMKAFLLTFGVSFLGESG